MLFRSVRDIASAMNAPSRNQQKSRYCGNVGDAVYAPDAAWPARMMFTDRALRRDCTADDMPSDQPHHTWSSAGRQPVAAAHRNRTVSAGRLIRSSSPRFDAWLLVGELLLVASCRSSAVRSGRGGSVASTPRDFLNH